MVPQIQIYFDYLSPYSYLAWTQIHSLADRHKTTVEPQPILLAALLNACGTKGPAEVPIKREYLIKDVYRTASFLEVPLNIPPTHPFNPLPALRLTCVDLGKDKRKKLIDVIFGMAWGQGLDISNLEVLTEACKQTGVDPAVAFAEAKTDKIKNKLKSNTDEALAKNAFGVPSIFVDENLFFGFDSFPNLERYLDGQPEISKTLFKKWLQTKPSASRL